MVGSGREYISSENDLVDFTINELLEILRIAVGIDVLVSKVDYDPVV